MENITRASVYEKAMPGRLSGGQTTEKRNHFGAILRRRRIARGVRPKDMIARLGVLGWEIDNVTFSHIENGRRIISDLELLILCQALKVSLAELAKENSL